MVAGMMYKWAEGARVNMPVETVGNEIVRLKEVNGGTLSRAQMVAGCKPRGHVLHGLFTWNDKQAGIERRLDQAGYLLRSVVMVSVEQPYLTPVRAFVSVTICPTPDEKQTQVYTTFEAAMSDPELKEQVLAQALSEWRSFERKYGAITLLASGIAAMNRAIALGTTNLRQAG